jgi:hypothetical protein
MQCEHPTTPHRACFCIHMPRSLLVCLKGFSSFATYSLEHSTSFTCERNVFKPDTTVISSLVYVELISARNCSASMHILLFFIELMALSLQLFLVLPLRRAGIGNSLLETKVSDKIFRRAL